MTEATEPKHRISVESAALVREWLLSRGGIAVWHSANLSNPGARWTTPLRQADGSFTRKPSWESESTPARVIFHAASVEVVVPKEVKRFHVATRVGAQGFMVKVTDGGTRRIRAEVSKAGDDAWYEFDYGEHKNCVIYAPARVVPLEEWTVESEGAK